MTQPISRFYTKKIYLYMLFLYPYITATAAWKLFELVSKLLSTNFVFRKSKENKRASQKANYQTALLCCRSISFQYPWTPAMYLTTMQLIKPIVSICTPIGNSRYSFHNRNNTDYYYFLSVPPLLLSQSQSSFRDIFAIYSPFHSKFAEYLLYPQSFRLKSTLIPLRSNLCRHDITNLPSISSDKQSHKLAKSCFEWWIGFAINITSYHGSLRALERSRRTMHDRPLLWRNMGWHCR